MRTEASRGRPGPTRNHTAGRTDHTEGPVVSCGVAAWNGDNSQSLCERADRALYRSKEHGRNCVTAASD